MKYLVLSILFCMPVIHSLPQIPGLVVPQQKDRYHSLQACDYVETQFKGFDGVTESELWKKADSFFYRMPDDSIRIFLKDPSYVVRYYAFLKLLGMNDSYAFEALKGMRQDDTLMLYWFNDAGGYMPFNRLLAMEYERFIDLKYRQGGVCTLPDRHYLGDYTYRFPRAEKKKWAIVSREFESLVRTTGIEEDAGLVKGGIVIKYYTAPSYIAIWD